MRAWALLRFFFKNSAESQSKSERQNFINTETSYLRFICLHIPCFADTSKAYQKQLLRTSQEGVVALVEACIFIFIYILFFMHFAYYSLKFGVLF